MKLFKTIWWGVCLVVVSLIIPQSATIRNYKFPSVPKLNEEFDNVYYQMFKQDHITPDMIDDKNQESYSVYDATITYGLEVGSITYRTAQTRYYTITAYDFLGYVETVNYELGTANEYVASGSNTDPINMYAPIHLPQGATLISIAVNWYRDDAAASGTAQVCRTTATATGYVQMFSGNSNATTGNHTVTDSTILSNTYAVIDNSLYVYWANCLLDPNNSNTDVVLRNIIITYTVTVPD